MQHAAFQFFAGYGMGSMLAQFVIVPIIRRFWP